MCLPLTINIIFHTRGPSIQENLSYVFDFYVSDDIHFSHFGKLKTNFITTLHFALRLMY